jgi:hypothetical protein
VKSLGGLPQIVDVWMGPPDWALLKMVKTHAAVEEEAEVGICPLNRVSKNCNQLGVGLVVMG